MKPQEDHYRAFKFKMFQIFIKNTKRVVKKLVAYLPKNKDHILDDFTFNPKQFADGT